jgi:hypothetical protein
MAAFDWSGVRNTVLRLANEPGALEVFGASEHRYALEDPLSDSQVQEVESQLGVALPEDYRGFLLQVGAGGAGPSYGIFTLRRTAEEWRWFDGTIRTAAVRELISGPFPNPLHASADSLQDALNATHPDEYPEQYPDPDGEEAKAAKRAWGVRQAELARSLRTTGAVPVCHHGCGFREWLVVTGAERGTMWCDPEGDGIHLYPDQTGPDSHRMSFGQFYLSWLDDAVRTAAVTAGRTG